MTAVPKPLKFLRPHYDDLAGLYETWAPGPVQVSSPAHISLCQYLTIFFFLELVGRYAVCAWNDLRR